MSSTAVLAVLIVAVAGVVLFAHWPALRANAISFDDQQYLLDNYLVRNPGWASAGRFLGEVRNPSTVNGYYQPLAMISLMLDCAMGGGPDNLAAFHRTSLALHVANTALIIVLLYLLLGNAWAAAMAGLLFGVHPMTVEPVPWIGERKTLLATFFALWSLISYVRYVQARRGGWYALALSAFVLALMSKPTTTPLPLLLLLLDFWPLERINLRSAASPRPRAVSERPHSIAWAVLEKAPFFAVAIVAAVITYVSQKTGAGVYDPSALSPLRIPLTVCHNIVFYPWKMLRPVNLSSHYPFPEPMNLSQPMVLAGVVGTAVLIVLLLVSLRWTRALFTGWLLFFVAIFPTMGIIGFTDVIASDKYAYFPAIGLLLALAALLTCLLDTGKGRAQRLIVVAVVLVLSAAEVRGVRSYLTRWRDSETLYEYMLSLTPNVASLHDNLGIVLNRQGRTDEAFQHHARAVEMQPYDPEPYYNLANLLAKAGRLDEAAGRYVQALRLRPDYAESHNNLANVLVKQGRLDQAIVHYTEALRLTPANAGTHANLAMALSDQGKLDEAVGHFAEAVRLRPDRAEARFKLANALTALGRLDEAVVQYNESLRLKPPDPEAHNNLANVLAMRGNVDEAVAHYVEALRLDPAYAEAHNNLGFALARQDKLNEAVGHYAEALRLKPTYALAHKNLANALAIEGKLSEAVRHYREAIGLDPGMAEARKGLGQVLERQGKTKAAIREYQEALRLNPQDRDLRDRLK